MSTPDPATNPDPASTPGLEPGGGVRPGDTPPAEASATAGLAGSQDPPPTSGGGTFRTLGVVFGVLVVVLVVGVLVWAFVLG